MAIACEGSPVPRLASWGTVMTPSQLNNVRGVLQAKLLPLIEALNQLPGVVEDNSNVSAEGRDAPTKSWKPGNRPGFVNAP